MKKLLLIISILISLHTAARGNFVFSPINSSDGLSDDRVRNITQLPDGRIAIITEGLVNIYDGSNFRYIHYDDRMSYFLKDYSAFHRVYIDCDKHLWLKVQHKLFLFDLETEKFLPNTDKFFKNQGIKNHVKDLFMTMNHSFWYVTEGDELMYRKAGDSKANLFISQVSRQTGMNDLLYDVATSGEQLFLFYKSGVMVCYDISTHKRLYVEDFFCGKNNYTRSLTVVPYKNYLYQVRNGNNTGLLVRFNVVNRRWEKILETNYWQNTLTLDNEGNCWISSSAGLWLVNQSLKHKQLISPLHLVDGRIIETEISTQYNDNKGGLWLGSVDRGILYYHPNRFKFRNFGHSLFNLPDFKKISVRCFAEKKESILIGTQNGLFSKEKDSTSLLPFKGIPSNSVCEMLMKDSKNRIWLCTQNNGLFCLDNEKIKQLKIQESCLSIFEDFDGQLYLCTNKSVGILDSQTGNFKKATMPVKQNLGEIYQLTNFKKNLLLGYSYEGLFLYNTQNNSVTIPNINSALQQHSCHHYHCLFTDSRGLIWLGTMDGLYVYNPTNSTTRSFFKEEGLINNSIRSITEDDLSRLWISTSNGISRIDVSATEKSYVYSFYSYNHFDGVISTEFLPRSVLKTSYNSLLWGGLDGFNEINLNQINIPDQPLAVPLLTKLLLSGSEVRENELYEGNRILQRSINSTSEIQLKYFQNFIGFEFSALNYVNPTQTYYRYKLEGVDQEWNELKTANGIGYANYTNLAPGIYHFKVFAANNNRQWGKSYAMLTVTITPPIWKTGWAYAFYLSLILGTLYLSISYYDRLNRRKMKQQQQTDLDQMKYLFFTNISHELRTPLTLIITPLNSILTKVDHEPLKRQLMSIQKNAYELLRLVNQLLDFRKLDMKGETLELSYCHINDFVDVIAASFKEMAANNGIEFFSEPYDEDIYAYVDEGKMKKIINNLLSNAIKFTPSGGKISLKINREKTNSTIVIKVVDTGVGISNADIDPIFDRFYQAKNQGVTNTGSGIGLHLVKEYVELHNGFIEVKSQINQGSTFSVHIPSNLKPKENLTLKENIIGQNHQLKLLLVEDHIEFRTFLECELSEKYNIIVASNGKDALEKVVNDQPDLVITDVIMPEMSGVEFCSLLKKDIQTSHIPVIILTAKSSDGAQIESFKAGADAYLSKPFNMNILLLRIQYLIEQQEQRKKLFKNAIILNAKVLTSSNIDKELINNALRCVEKNMDNTTYSVEQLSKDLCMDRTGLYRKLLAIVGQTPSDFIRSVRLKRAAKLLEEGFSVSEVAGLVGFGTMSYFAKCFQDEFGVKPSQYKNNMIVRERSYNRDEE